LPGVRNLKKMTHILCNHGLCSDVAYCQCLRRSAARRPAAYHSRTRCLLELMFIAGNTASSHNVMTQSLRHVTTDTMPASHQAGSRASHNTSQPAGSRASHNTSTRRPLTSQNSQQPQMLPARQMAQHSMTYLVINTLTLHVDRLLHTVDSRACQMDS